MALSIGCDVDQPARNSGVTEHQKTAVEPAFTEVTAACGLDFMHFNGMSGRLFYPEVFAPGSAFVDYDNDGDLDLYLVQGGMLGEEIGASVDDASFPPRESLPLSDRLYQNLLDQDRQTGRLMFEDVTEVSGIVATGYGMGVATGDYDNDGWVDIYVTNLGPNQMLHNNHNGTFTDTTISAGVDDPSWSTSAAFFDFDRDGFLDLWVVNYVRFTAAVNTTCTGPNGRPDYCDPQTYDSVSDRLFRNRGDGTFEDVTGAAGLLRTAGAGLGVITADLDSDGWADVYVANDGERNNLWMNRGDGTFEDGALMAGSAVNVEGRSEASMGLVVADLDADGDEDLFVTHLRTETNTFYRNTGSATFEDATAQFRLAAPSLGKTSFGVAAVDFDCDRDLDLFVVNGAVTQIDHLVVAGDPFPLHQKNQLFVNNGNARFEALDERAGSLTIHSEVGRGLATGDVDNDGDLDFLVTNTAGPARLHLNRIGQDLNWIGFRTVGPSGRDQLGATVEVYQPGLPPLIRRGHSDGSYCSARDPRVVFGLADEQGDITVRVRWPSGEVEQWYSLPARQYSTLVSGSGQAFDEHPP